MATGFLLLCLLMGTLVPRRPGAAVAGQVAAEPRRGAQRRRRSAASRRTAAPSADARVRVSPMPYTPPQEILDRYASVLVDFALGGGSGVQAGEVVRIAAPEAQSRCMRRCIARCGGRARTRSVPTSRTMSRR